MQELESKWAPQFAKPMHLAWQLLQLGWITPFQVDQILRSDRPEVACGPYRLLARLGQGGVCRVFKAVDTTDAAAGREAGPDLVEQFLEEGLAALVRLMAVAVLARVPWLILPGVLVPWLWGRRSGRIFLDDFVEFAAIEPDAAAGGAIIDFHSLALRHHERGLVDRAKI